VHTQTAWQCCFKSIQNVALLRLQGNIERAAGCRPVGRAVRPSLLLHGRLRTGHAAGGRARGRRRACGGRGAPCGRRGRARARIAPHHRRRGRRTRRSAAARSGRRAGLACCRLWSQWSARQRTGVRGRLRTPRSRRGGRRRSGGAWGADGRGGGARGGGGADGGGGRGRGPGGQHCRGRQGAPALHAALLACEKSCAP